jgi:hypothetical protein
MLERVDAHGRSRTETVVLTRAQGTKSSLIRSHRTSETSALRTAPGVRSTTTTYGRTMIGGSTGVRGRISSSMPSTRPSVRRSSPTSSNVSRSAVSSSDASAGSKRPPGSPI